jgi:hypothetical protein
MKVKEILKGIYQVDFETRAELLKTFLRFQEYYESPEFKGKVFTLKEYKEWYKKNQGKGRFTYYSDWSGCNVPSSAIYAVNFDFNNRTKREMALINALPTIGDYYVIGTFDGGRNDVLAHETAHGLYYTNPEYRHEMFQLIGSLSEEVLERMFRKLERFGYHHSVFSDEIQAYMATTSPHELVSNFGMEPQEAIDALSFKRVYLRYSK